MLKRIGPCRVSTGSPGQRPLILGAEAGPAVQATASTQRRVRVVRLDLHGMPEREDMVGEVESDPLEAGDGSTIRVCRRTNVLRKPVRR
jgi:hypothetical protein